MLSLFSGGSESSTVEAQPTVAVALNVTKSRAGRSLSGQATGKEGEGVKAGSFR
jgi:hypothetical protein